MKGLAGRGLMRQQQTIRKPVTCTGVGLHCGCRVSLTLAPAPPDTGIVFIRTDLSTKPRVPAAIANVRPTLLSTTVGVDGVQVQSIEHLLAASAGRGIDTLSDEGLLNEGGLRYRDEFVRHKILDLVGDMTLLGMPVVGEILAIRSGHALHARLVSRILESRDNWVLVSAEPHAPAGRLRELPPSLVASPQRD